jgi:MFS family permease
MFEYVSGAMVGPSFGAFIADNSNDENRAKVFGLVTSIFHVVGIVGPPLGGFIAFRFGYKPMFMTAAIMYFLAALGRIWMANKADFEVKKHEGVGEQLNFGNLKENLMIMLKLIVGGGILTWIFITDGVRDITLSISNQFEPLYLANIGNMNEEQIGFMSSIFNIALTLSLAPAGWLAAKISERKAIILGYVIQALAFLIFLRAATFPVFAVSWFLMGAGFGIMDPSYDSIISKAVPEKNRGLAYGLFFTSISLLALPAPYFGGYLWERYTPRTPFIITAIFTVLVMIPVWFKFKVPPQSEEAQASK